MMKGKKIEFKFFLVGLDINSGNIGSFCIHRDGVRQQKSEIQKGRDVICDEASTAAVSKYFQKKARPWTLRPGPCFCSISVPCYYFAGLKGPIHWFSTHFRQKLIDC